MKVMMRALLLIAVGLAAVSTFAQTNAQTKTVTNASLEKFRAERVQGDRDLRENYERLGFSSPEERDRRLEAWNRENQQLVDKWEQQLRDQQNASALADQSAAIDRLGQSMQQNATPRYDPNYNSTQTWGYGGYNDGFGYYGIPYPYPNRPGYYPNRNRYNPYGYPPIYPPSGSVSGGMYWPAPTPARPYYRRPRR